MHLSSHGLESASQLLLLFWNRSNRIESHAAGNREGDNQTTTITNCHRWLLRAQQEEPGGCWKCVGAEASCKWGFGSVACIAFVLHSREACSALTISSRTLLWITIGVQAAFLINNRHNRIRWGKQFINWGLDLFVSSFLVRVRRRRRIASVASFKINRQRSNY